MLKYLIMIVAFPIVTFGQTNLINSGSIFKGFEVVNRVRTGNACQVSVVTIQPFAGRKHCFEAQVNVELPSVANFKGGYMFTRVSNSYKPEYPKIKTCAVDLDGNTWSDEIIGEDTSHIYNPIFMGGGSGSPRFDYFLNISPQNKLPYSFRVHVLTAGSEYDVDCLGLE